MTSSLEGMSILTIHEPHLCQSALIRYQATSALGTDPAKASMTISMLTLHRLQSVPVLLDRGLALESLTWLWDHCDRWMAVDGIL